MIVCVLIKKLGQALQIIPWISLGGFHIFPHISPERKDHVKNNRRTHRQQGSVHKILADPAGGDAHTGADSRTDPKGIPLYKAFEFVHTSNLKNCSRTYNISLLTSLFFRKFAALEKCAD